MRRYSTIVRATAAAAAILLTHAGPMWQTHAQQGLMTLSAARTPTTITTGVGFEDYKADEAEVSELSSRLYLTVPIGKHIVASVLSGYATVSGRDERSVSGFDDAQVTVTGSHRTGNGSLLFTVSGNLPSGKRELQLSEFDTSVPLSYNFFDFSIPSFGQAPGVSVGGAAALAPTRRLAVGLGASYALHAGFKPIAGMVDTYKPGNELVLTSGVEVGLSQQTTVSADFTYTMYSDDTFSNVTIFEAGSKAVVVLQLTSHFGHNTLTVVARHRTHADSRLLSSGALVRDDALTLPAQTETAVSYEIRASQRFFVDLFSSARHFKESPAFTEKLAFDIGVGPSIRISRVLAVLSRVAYTFGDIEGYEAGLDLNVQL